MDKPRLQPVLFWMELMTRSKYGAIATASPTRMGRITLLNTQNPVYTAKKALYWPGARGLAPDLLLDKNHAIEKKVVWLKLDTNP
mmetsp:Transcript_26451/g.61569  ORF Transcript_26451/g.61569 Transcript_26451/m.61569 type:complete len:85 (+) Transcript_26451:75-329(+)